MVLDACESIRWLVGFANDRAIGSHDGDAQPGLLRQRMSEGIDVFDLERDPVELRGNEFARQNCVASEITPNPVDEMRRKIGVNAQIDDEQQDGEQHRQRAEPSPLKTQHAPHSVNRYPTPRTVSMESATLPSFSRRRRTCVSTVRVSTSPS